MRETDYEAMRQALNEAAQAQAEGEIPVGAVIVCQGKIIASAHNLREKLVDPTAHAEVLAIRQAAKALNSRRLQRCSLFVTLEPCAMCAGAAVAAGIERIVFGAYDAQRGCAGSRYSIPEDPELGSTKCVGGFMEKESGDLLRDFFETKR